MKSSKLLFVLLLVVILPAAGFADYPAFTVKISPALNIPLGTSAEDFTLGGGGDISGNFTMPFFLPFTAGLDIGYDISPIKSGEATDAQAGTQESYALSFLSFSGVLGLNFEIIPRLFLSVNGKVGYFYTFFNDDPSTGGGSIIVGGGGGVHFRIIPLLSLGVEGAYRNHIGLRNDISVSLGGTLNFGSRGEKMVPGAKKRPGRTGPKPQPLTKDKEKDAEAGAAEEAEGKEGRPRSADTGEGVDIKSVDFVTLFPVFFKYYDDNPIGTVTIKNYEDVPVESVKVSFYEKQYMNNPKEAGIIEQLAPAEERNIELYGLFTNSILEITEGTKLSALINIEYVKGQEIVEKEYIETVRVHNRNALTWDDDRKACAFVTAKDPAVLKFSKNVVGWVGSDISRAISKNLQIGMAFHEALDLYGITYIIDPTTPYRELSRDELAVDYLQFPKQTLEFMAGDCDDLSILYAALLEAAGIETAFITTPGHIFVAFNLEMSPAEARGRFLYPDDLIFRNGATWLPVEITERGNGFVTAWRTGAKEWRENEPKGQAGFFPMHAAWKVYEPVGLPGTVPVELPERQKIVKAFENELQRFVSREMEPQLAHLREKIEATRGDIRYVNKLGVLYAKYGMNEKAEAEFRSILEQKEYLPALLNMGNLYYLEGDYFKAREFYSRAEKRSPDHPKVLLSLARANHQLENYTTTRDAYTKLQQVSPELAERFSYLDLQGEEASRATDISTVRDLVLWEETE
jgi:tetratricopeptide (TPR) repeat protein